MTGNFTGIKLMRNKALTVRQGSFEKDRQLFEHVFVIQRTVPDLVFKQSLTFGQSAMTSCFHNA